MVGVRGAADPKFCDERAVGEITEYIDPRIRVKGYIIKMVTEGCVLAFVLVRLVCDGEPLRGYAVDVAMMRGRKRV
jgi:hypothetical protein